MSTSDAIKKATQQLVENKRESLFSNAGLEDMANMWVNENSDYQTLFQNINEEQLQNKIDEYLVSLNYGRFSPADFPNISEFCNSYEGFKLNSELMKRIENLQETMERCRLQMPNTVSIAFDENLKTEFRIPHLNQISISGNSQQIKELDNPREISAKTFNFKDDNNNEIGGVEYDLQNNAHILYTDINGNVVEYKLTPEKNFSRINEDKTETMLDIKNKESLSTQDIKAYNLAIASKKAWQKYINKELDKNIMKQASTISQGKGKEKATPQTTKVNENITEAETSIPTTKFDEKPSQPKKEADFDNDTTNKFAPKPDELYWKEDDIIKVMFQDWFLAFANSATNWGIHQIEYAAAGIYDAAVRSYRNSNKESKEQAPEKTDSTHQFYGEIEKISLQNMKKNTEEENKKIIEQIKSGNTHDVLIQNDSLRFFGQQTGIDIEKILSQGNPEKTVPLLTSCASIYGIYTDTYARASLLDSKMNDYHNFIGADNENLYNQKRQEGGKILKRQLYEQMKGSANKQADFNLFFDKLKKSAKDMNKALEQGLNDYNKKHYDEQGKKPKENKILKEYQTVLDQNTPENLFEFSQRQSEIIRNRDYIVSGVNTEKMELDLAEANNNTRRQHLLKNKNFILKGLTSEKEMINTTNNIQIPLRPVERE